MSCLLLYIYLQILKLVTVAHILFFWNSVHFEWWVSGQGCVRYSRSGFAKPAARAVDKPRPVSNTPKIFSNNRSWFPKRFPTQWGSGETRHACFAIVLRAGVAQRRKILRLCGSEGLMNQTPTPGLISIMFRFVGTFHRVAYIIGLFLRHPGQINT